MSNSIKINIDNEEFEIDIPEGDYETIAGYITAAIGRIPDKGEKIELENYYFVILHSSKTKINLVKMFVYPKATSEEE